ncbi:unnamed protein product [Caenorhabditis brenneri]
MTIAHETNRLLMDADRQKEQRGQTTPKMCHVPPQTPRELCKNRVCATAYTVHHKSICDKNAYPAAAPNAQQDNRDQDNDE